METEARQEAERQTRTEIEARRQAEEEIARLRALLEQPRTVSPDPAPGDPSGC